MISSPRSATLSAGLLVIALVLSGCGSDSNDDDASPDSTTTAGVDPTTTASETTSTTAGTTTEPAPDVDALVQGSITSDDDVTATWALTGSTEELCFVATLAHPDAATSGTLGDGISECVEPQDGIATLEDALSVSVGVVDGARTFGYLWGRADAAIVSLIVTHIDDSETTVELFDGPGGVQVFAVILDTTTIPEVATLDAFSASGLEDSEAIREFLRAGPTYPTVAPVTTPEADLYPTAGG